MPNVINQIVGKNTIKMIVKNSERGPAGPPGPDGPQGIPGPKGEDGAIVYKPGTGISIIGNTISATGVADVKWGGITGNIADQNDLHSALNKTVVETIGNGTNTATTVKLQIVNTNIETNSSTITEVALPVANALKAGIITADTMGQIADNTVDIVELTDEVGTKLDASNITTDGSISKVATTSGNSTTLQLGIATGGVQAANIATGAVSATKIAAGAINGADNDASGVGTTKLAFNTVGTPNLRDGAVTASKIDFASVGMHIYYATIGDSVTFTADADMYVEIEALTGYKWGYGGSTVSIDVTENTGLTPIFKRSGGLSSGDSVGRQMALMALYSTTANTDVTISVTASGNPTGGGGGSDYYIVRCYKLAEVH